MRYLLLVVALGLLGCSNILDLAEGLLIKEPDVAEPASPVTVSSVIAEAQAETTAEVLAQVEAIVLKHWGTELPPEFQEALSAVLAEGQAKLIAGLLDSEAEAVRRLEERLRTLASGD